VLILRSLFLITRGNISDYLNIIFLTTQCQISKMVKLSHFLIDQTNRSGESSLSFCITQTNRSGESSLSFCITQTNRSGESSLS